MIKLLGLEFIVMSDKTYSENQLNSIAKLLAESDEIISILLLLYKSKKLSFETLQKRINDNKVSTVDLADTLVKLDRLEMVTKDATQRSYQLTKLGKKITSGLNRVAKISKQ